VDAANPWSVKLPQRQGPPQAEFDKWNSQDSGVVKAATAAIYTTFYDKFDLIFFLLNKPDTPANAWAYSYQTRNDISGLGGGMPMFNNDAQYGSAGQLQHLAFLQKLSYSGQSFLTTGPTVHEIGHRWFNFSTTYPGSSHWPNYSLTGTFTATDGIFGGIWNNYAPVELYLMGLIPSNDPSLTGQNLTYENAFINESGIRSPDPSTSQKAFRGLVVVVTTTSLTSDEISITDTGVKDLTSTTQGGVVSGDNFWRQTSNKATLKLDGLLDSDTRR
jgi:hypothetical protein